MKYINQKIKNLLPYLIVVLAIVLPFFFKPGYMFFTDFVFGPNTRPDWASGGIVYNLLIKILPLIFPMDIVQKIIITTAVSLILLGGKKIAEAFLSDKWEVFIVSLFVLFNPFVYDRLLFGQISNVALAFGFFCLGIGYLFEFLKKREDRQFFLAGIFTAISIQFSMHFAFFAGVFWILTSIISVKYFAKENRQKIIKNIFFLAFIFLVLNINLFSGIFLKNSPVGKSLSGGIQRQDLIAFQTSGKNGIDALKNVVMMSGFWGKDQYRYLDISKLSDDWGRSFMLLLPLIMLGLFLMLGKEKMHNEKKDSVTDSGSTSFSSVMYKNINLLYMALGLSVLYIIAVILAVGIRLPLTSGITYWLFDHFPFYKGMRETQKWVAVVVVIYAIFLSVGVRKLFCSKIVQANKSIISLFLVGVIVMQTPLLLWGFGGQVKPTPYPKDWYEANDYIVQDQTASIKNKKCQDEILFLPWHLYMSFGWIGNVVANPAKEFFDCPVISGTDMEWGGIYDSSQSYEGSLINEWLAKSGGTELLIGDKLDIRYIVLAKELDWKNYSWIEKDPGTELVKDTPMLRVYKVVMK